ncbi:lysozyme inhibitor LprI family protein [Burkholderia contaminans]|uniref:lysozyme inhibitor LprI family protein n=2 Tax=Burkholderia contaminans TaxID=488447 RepID=UPI00310F2BA7
MPGRHPARILFSCSFVSSNPAQQESCAAPGPAAAAMPHLRAMKAALGGFAEQGTAWRAGPWSHLARPARYFLAAAPLINIEPPESRDRRFVQEAMKKTICLALLLLPLSARAETCASDGNVHDDLSCVDRALTQSKKDLNLIYRKIYAATQYKNEFEQSQKAWLDYRDRQCNGYIAAEASQSQGEGSGLITRDCLLTITRQRVDYLKTLVGK